jgi:putative hydrolase of HD superfamily
MLLVASLSMDFGLIRRATLHINGERETDTTHSFMLALMVLEVGRGLLPSLQVDVACQMALVHDLPEIFAGDTSTLLPLSPEAREAKEERERAATARLGALLGAESQLLRMLHRYERQACLESVFVRYLDKFVPKYTQILTDGAAVRGAGISHEEYAESLRLQGEKLRRMAPDLEVMHGAFEDLCERTLASFSWKAAQLHCAPRC